MAWDIEMARAIKNETRGVLKATQVKWYRAKVAQVTPTLVFTISDERMKFDAETGTLIMTRTAAGRTWTEGLEAAAILQGAELLVLDAL